MQEEKKISEKKTKVKRSKAEKETAKKREPGCRGALPGVCVVHAFQPGGSKPGRGRAQHTLPHRHTASVHTQKYIRIPKGETFNEHKKYIIYTLR